MEAIRQFVVIPENHRIFIDIPKYIEAEQLAEVILIVRESRGKKEKLKDIELAMKDPMFIADMKEVNEDFKNIDCEEW